MSLSSVSVCSLCLLCLPLSYSLLLTVFVCHVSVSSIFNCLYLCLLSLSAVCLLFLSAVSVGCLCLLSLFYCLLLTVSVCHVSVPTFIHLYLPLSSTVFICNFCMPCICSHVRPSLFLYVSVLLIATKCVYLCTMHQFPCMSISIFFCHCFWLSLTVSICWPCICSALCPSLSVPVSDCVCVSCICSDVYLSLSFSVSDSCLNICH